MTMFTYPIFPQKIAEYIVNQTLIGNYLPIVLSFTAAVLFFVVCVIISRHDSDSNDNNENNEC